MVLGVCAAAHFVSYLVFARGRRNSQCVQLGQCLRLQARAERLLSYPLLGIVNLVQDILAKNRWLGRFEFIRIQLPLDGNRNTMLLSCQVYRENTVNL